MKKKIVLLGTLMVKSACAWYEQWVKSHSRASGQITSTYAEFVKDLESTFKDKLEVTTARHKVFSSRQGTRSISDYAIEFRTLCSKAELEVDHQIDIFMKSLNSGIKAIWHPQTMPKILDEMVDQIRTTESLGFHQHPGHYPSFQMYLIWKNKRTFPNLNLVGILM
ncbi:hypothetical protein SeLEV6574_g07993 [Synchytrium endobioticum]|uniref:Retrotransposon gag domain-containing protein n=1 Tax=Synchytrium endobioticum TaxID=286115 RepID=A0A507C5I2_9FUNG|nr:hypothetical protein SeLEV6574_g07993 [Synchytrium endobioticum]